MFAKTLIACALLLCSQNDAAPRRMQRMTVTKMRAADLESSATGYVYNQQQGLPVYYVQYTNHGSGRYYHTPDSNQYVVDAAAPVAHGVPETTPLLHGYASAENGPHAAKQAHENEETANYESENMIEHVTPAILSKPQAPYFAPAKLDETEDNGEHGYDDKEESDDSKEDDEEEDEEDDDEEEDHEDDDDGKIHSGFEYPVKGSYTGSSYGSKGSGGSYDSGDSSFESGGGEKYSAGESSEHGEKGQKGYKNRQEFSKGEYGSNDNEHREGYYGEKGGHKKGHIDDAEEHGSHKEVESGEDGSDYGKASHHKKGQKTNGFHNIYHKDEYKKETDFYDDDHKKGYFDKYEEFDKSYKAVEDGFKKGGHQSSGYDQQDRGKKGQYDKGHHESQDQGHDSEDGEKSYFANYEDYGSEKNSKSGRAHKFQNGNAGHY